MPSRKRAAAAPFARAFALSTVYAMGCLVGCSAPEKPAVQPAPVEVVTPIPTATETAVVEIEPPAAEAPPSLIDLPKKSGCILQSEWHGKTWKTALHFRGSGPVFANVIGGTARLHYPLGARSPALGLEVEGSGISLKGYIETDDADLRAAKPFWLSGLALPTLFTRFDWTESKDGELTVTAETPSGLEVLSPPLSASRPCTDLTLGAGSINTDAEIMALSKNKPVPKHLVSGKAIDIATEAGGKAVARARPNATQLEVGLIEQKGKNARILWKIGTLYVVGWVASSDLKKPESGVGYGSGHGRLGSRNSAENYKKVVCQVDLPLVAEAQSEKAMVGVLRAGTVIGIPSASGAFTNVIVKSALLEPSDGANWMVLTSDLRDCQSPPP